MTKASLKTSLRQEFKKRRSLIPQARRQPFHLDLQGRVLSFSSFGTEIDTHSFNRKLAEEKRLILPKVVGHELHLFQVDDFDQLALSKWGILEPIPERCKPADQIDTILVPALAFDKHKYRLGYGKGHYDRLLSRVTAYSIGIGFHEQLTDELPREPHDKALDQLILF